MDERASEREREEPIHKNVHGERTTIQGEEVASSWGEKWCQESSHGIGVEFCGQKRFWLI